MAMRRMRQYNGREYHGAIDQESADLLFVAVVYALNGS